MLLSFQLKRLYQKHIKYSVGLLKAKMPRTKKAALATKRCYKSSDSKTKPEKDIATSNPKKTKTEKDTGPSNPQKTKPEKEETSKYFGNDASDSVITNKEAGGEGKNPSAAKTTSGGNRMQYEFFDVSCEDLAMALLGQKLVHVVDGKRLTGIIVETEAYLGPIDKGAHSYEGKRTAKNEAMYMPPGTAYVYNIYGLYCCMNISAKGEGAAVLLRGLQPIENLEEMDSLRTKGKATSFMKNDGQGLCNGPSKLCQALNIKKDAINGVDLCSASDIWVEKGDKIDPKSIVKCKRINIDYAGDWKDKPLRFYILGNKFNSVKDKEEEKKISDT